MKTIMKTSICLPVAAMILTVALAIPAAAQHQVPFNLDYAHDQRFERLSTLLMLSVIE